jgi:hypothetical protein
MGLSIQLITADAAQNQQIKQEHGVTVITPANKTVQTPAPVGLPGGGERRPTL